jgi:hypothetical protein
LWQISSSAKWQLLDDGAKIAAAVALRHFQQGLIEWYGFRQWYCYWIALIVCTTPCVSRASNANEEQAYFGKEGKQFLLQEMIAFVRDTNDEELSKGRSLTFQDLFYCNVSQMPYICKNLLEHQSKKFGDTPDIRADPGAVLRIRHVNGVILVCAILPSLALSLSCVCVCVCVCVWLGGFACSCCWWWF